MRSMNVSGQWSKRVLQGSLFAATILASTALCALAAAADETASPTASEKPEAGEKKEGVEEKHEGKGELKEEAREEGKEGKGEEKEEEEKRFFLGVDYVMGFGRAENAHSIVEPGRIAPIYGVSQDRVMVHSFVFGAAYELKNGLSFDANLPYTAAMFRPDSGSIGYSAIGNLELAIAHTMKKNPLTVGLAFALPTAQGEEPKKPEGGGELDPATINGDTFNRNAVNRAAAASRGFESNALFETHRFGIIPFFTYKANLKSGLMIHPFLKVENLIDTSGRADHKYIGELVVGTRVAYGFGGEAGEGMKKLDVGLRLWINATYAGAEEGSKKVTLVAEPQLRGHFGALSPTLGLIVPIAGALNDPRYTGIRLGVVVGF